ncbi:M23 family metallopeptidase [Candidatus Neomarinimicrobiota bacterium]
MQNIFKNILIIVFGIILIILISNCEDKDITDPPISNRQECLNEANFGQKDDSPYCLPYNEGMEFEVYQSYCSPFPGSHEKRFAIDFLMPIGTEIIAARAGEVVELREQWPDDDRIGNHNNMVCLRHSDDTLSLYIHMKQDGIDVELGEFVPKGGHLGWSGSSGDTNGVPHLHFQVCLRAGMCSTETGEFTLPINFSNADGQHDTRNGLITGELYLATECN